MNTDRRRWPGATLWILFVLLMGTGAWGAGALDPGAFSRIYVDSDGNNYLDTDGGELKVYTAAYPAGKTLADLKTTSEEVDDRVSALLQPAANNYLTWTYDDVSGTLTPVLDSDLLDLADGTLSASKVAGVADADYGDVTVSGGAWSVENDSHAHSAYQAVDTDLTDLAGLTAATGDLIVGNGAGDWAKLSGNTTTGRYFLRSIGTGAAATLPVWAALTDADVPDTITASNYQPLDADLTDLADGSLTASKVAGVADADYGDVTVSGGAWSVENDSHAHASLISSTAAIYASSDSGLIVDSYDGMAFSPVSASNFKSSGGKWLSDSGFTSRNAADSANGNITGATITASTFAGGNVANWDTAYGWGDHSGEGYLTAEVDGSTTNELQNLFSTISCPAGSNPAADSQTDTLGLLAGTGISITGDSVNDTVTITATGGAAPAAHASEHVTGGSDIIAEAVASTSNGLMSAADKAKLDGIASGATAYTDEAAQDAAGAMVTGNTETGIAVTYDDPTGKLNFVVSTPSNVTDGDKGDVTISSGSWAVENDSHTHGTSTIAGLDAANDISSGTLDNARFSAYSDLGAESKIGTGATQLAAGDRGVTNGDSHDHNGGDGAVISVIGNSGPTSGDTYAGNSYTDRTIVRAASGLWVRNAGDTEYTGVRAAEFQLHATSEKTKWYSPIGYTVMYGSNISSSWDGSTLLTVLGQSTAIRFDIPDRFSRITGLKVRGRMSSSSRWIYGGVKAFDVVTGSTTTAVNGATVDTSSGIDTFVSGAALNVDENDCITVLLHADMFVNGGTVYWIEAIGITYTTQ